MTFIDANIPTMLKQHLNWVVWGVRGAPPKAPCNPASLLSGRPQFAKAGVRETWSDYYNAVECVRQGLAQGVGYQFDGNGIYGIDLDNVRTESGKLTSEASEIVSKLNSYTEVSPSGKGLHVLALAPNANITRHRKKDYFLEIYGKDRYFTITGNICGNKNIETRTAELQGIHDKFLLPEQSQITANVIPQMGTSNTEHNRFLEMGLKRDKGFSALWSGERRHGNESADDLALMNKLAYWCNADSNAMMRAFLSSPYHAQKDEFHRKKCQRSDYLPNTAKTACSSLRSTAVADYEKWQQNRNTPKVCATR